jgi:hypothetical protein
MLAPADAKPQEAQLFAEDLGAVLESLCPRVEETVHWEGVPQVEKIA